MWSSLNKYNDLALLFLRLGVGGFMIWLKGWTNLSAGVKQWAKMGNAMQQVEITFVPEVWGFIAAFAQSVGAVFFILGLFFRPAALLLFLTMLIGAIFEVRVNSWGSAHHALNLAVLFFALLFIGPGKFSIDKG